MLLRLWRRRCCDRLTKDRPRPGRTAVMKVLQIVWQRLVTSDGRTCDRCDATHREMQRAMTILADVLRPLGIQPTLATKEIDEKSFRANPSESNRVWIAGRPMEEWLGANVGTSLCCSVCGESQCRTVEVGGTKFEAIPEQLFLKAALIAASQLLEPPNEEVRPPKPPRV